MTTTLTARRLITNERALDFPVLTVEDGVVTHISSDPEFLAAETDTLTAAFLDIHTHGAMGHDVMSASASELSELQRFLATRGVGHYLPTTVTASVDETLGALDRLADLIEATTPVNEATPVGIHLEGAVSVSCQAGRPCGGHAPAAQHRVVRPVPVGGAGAHQARDHRSGTQSGGQSGSPTHRGCTCCDGGEVFSELRHRPHSSRHGPRRRVSLGHSNATAEQTLAAIAAGATSATHAFNAMRPLDHREPGILGTVLTDDRLFAELICDGVHVAPALVRLWLRAKGLECAILVTDSMSATGMGDGEYTLAGQPVTVANHKAVLTESPSTLGWVGSYDGCGSGEFAGFYWNWPWGGCAVGFA